MDIQEKQAKWNQERPLFEAEFIHSCWLQFFNFNNNTGDYELKESHQNDEDAKLAFEVVNTGWVMWLRAKAQKVAVPDGFVLVNAESLGLQAQSIRMFNTGENYSEDIEEFVCNIESMIEAQEQVG